MKYPVSKNTSTVEGRAIWKAAKKAADNIPEWAKKNVERCVNEKLEELKLLWNQSKS